MYKGLQVTPLIFDILIQVRTYIIALTTDIKKAFHHVCMKKTDFFRFLWTDGFSDQPKIVRNRFARVIFGVTFLPYLLNEASRKHAKKYEFDIDFMNKIFDCFYGDGLQSSTTFLTWLKKLKLRFLNRLFYYRKWTTNNPKLHKIISENTFNYLQPERILWNLWEELDDVLVFDFFEICETYKTLDITKKNMKNFHS